jgi:hypothetical protein
MAYLPGVFASIQVLPQPIPSSFACFLLIPWDGFFGHCERIDVVRSRHTSFFQLIPPGFCGFLIIRSNFFTLLPQMLSARGGRIALRDIFA